MLERNFVTPSQTTPQPAYVPPTWMASVRAKLAADILAAVGVFLLTGVAMFLSGRPIEAVAGVSVITAMVVLGVRLSGLVGATKVLATLTWQAAELAQVRSHCAELVGIVAEKDKVIAAISNERNRAIDDADGLRTQVQKGWRSAESLERKGRADAAAIIELCAGGWVARDAAIVRLGWTSDAAGRQRWESADALLLRAGVIARNHRTTTILATGADALTLLDKQNQTTGD